MNNRTKRTINVILAVATYVIVGLVVIVIGNDTLLSILLANIVAFFASEFAYRFLEGQV